MYHKFEFGGQAVTVLVDMASAKPCAPVLWPSIGEYPCYDAFLYQNLTTDEVRNEEFRRAIKRSVPGKAVLDIGTGKDLIWARESVRYGASRVLAMEAMGDSFQQASGTLRSLGLEDDISLAEGLSTVLETDSRAEVCVAEVIGSVAGAEGAAAIIDDARRRHLTPGGTVIPHRAVTLAGAVCLAEVMGGRPVAFATGSLRYLQAIFGWNAGPFDVRLRIGNPVASAVLSSVEAVEVLDFNGDLRLEQEIHAELTIERPGHVDGVLTWLGLWCAPGRAPLVALDGRSSWASVYFPLFDSEVAVRRGDVLALTFRTKLSDDGLHPDYRLTAVLRTQDGEFAAAHESPHHGPVFRDRRIYRDLFPVHW